MFNLILCGFNLTLHKIIFYICKPPIILDSVDQFLYFFLCNCFFSVPLPSVNSTQALLFVSTH